MEARPISLQNAIDDLGFGPFQRRLLLVCGVTWAADAAEIFLIAFALPGIRKDFGLSTFGSAWVVTAGFLGMLVGAWFWGTISDRIGRRRGFTMTIGIFAVFGLLPPTRSGWACCASRPGSGSAAPSRSTSRCSPSTCPPGTGAAGW
jgi:MFS family permease